MAGFGSTPNSTPNASSPSPAFGGPQQATAAPQRAGQPASTGGGFGGAGGGQAAADPAAPKRSGNGMLVGIGIAIVAAIGLSLALSHQTPSPAVAPAMTPQPVVIQQVSATPQMQPIANMPPQVVGRIGSIREDSSKEGGPMWGFFAESGTTKTSVQRVADAGTTLVAEDQIVTGWQIVGFTGANAAAVRAGMQIGDIMTSYNGIPLGMDGSTVARIHASGEQPLDTTTVVAYRNGVRMTFTGPVGYQSSWADLHPGTGGTP